jgi:glycyl-tRNA synthetase beta chain
MRWGENNYLWPRPLRNILCLFDGKILQFSYHDLKTNNVTFGHKFLSKKIDREQLLLSEIKVNNWQEYLLALRNNGVILDQKERSENIRDQAMMLLRASGLKEKLCSDLLVDVVGTVELPFVMLGTIPAMYMSLPEEIITTVMRVHQKYFPTYEKSNGNLAPYFLSVGNGDPHETVKFGNERVLGARLADAYFLYGQDLAVPIQQRYAQLERIAFHAKLGSVKDKAARLEALTEMFDLDPMLQSNFVVAAKLCKCDLAGDVVADLPVLQGYMGYYYALNAGYCLDIALAIKEHYLPAGMKDDLPKSSLGLKLSLIDKIDSLVGMYLARERATGNKDPYGLRRLALGIIRIFSAANFTSKVNLCDLVHQSVKLYKITDFSKENLVEEILTFIKLRHKNLLNTEFDTNIVNSVIDSPLYDIATSHSKCLVVRKFTQEAIYEFIAQVFKRIFNFVSQEPGLDEYVVKPGLSIAEFFIETFTDQYSEELGRGEIVQVLRALEIYDADQQDLELCLAQLHPLCVSLNTFLDKVKVSECLPYKLILAAALKLFNRAITFRHL